MKRFLRYLRIAFSATCVIACVLLIALWVRTSAQGVRGQLPTRNVAMSIEETSLNVLLGLYTTGEGLQLDTSGLPAETLAKPITIAYEGDQRGFLEQLHDKTGLYFSINNVASASTLSITSQPKLTYRWMFYGALVISIALAAAPWMPEIRWRFSLRTLFIVTTLVAVVLGLIVWAVR